MSPSANPEKSLELHDITLSLDTKTQPINVVGDKSISLLKKLSTYLPEIHLVDIDKKVVTPSEIEKGSGPKSGSDSSSGSYGTFQCDCMTVEDSRTEKERENGVLMSFLGSLLVVGCLLLVSFIGVGLFWF